MGLAYGLTRGPPDPAFFVVDTGKYIFKFIFNIKRGVLVFLVTRPFGAHHNTLIAELDRDSLILGLFLVGFSLFFVAQKRLKDRTGPKLFYSPPCVRGL